MYENDLQAILDEGLTSMRDAETIIAPQRTMIYTVGDSIVYDKLFGVINSKPLKKGKSEGYKGGICFSDIFEASEYKNHLNFLNESNLGAYYEVYGLNCGLDNTYESDGLRFLINDAELIKL